MAPIEPYRLRIVWKLPLAGGFFSAPELGLYSSSTVAGSANPILIDADIRKCMGIIDFAYVEGRIEHFLSKLAKTKQK
jgi:hypothetical protein